ncbi:hypothetical protein BGZ79_000048 [Entomortierella chlamydospora]|nr:hypothetical protein BGZ79_000048 [Entomortierella chlamydospora]
MPLNQKSIKALESLKSHPWITDKFISNKRSAVLVALLPNSEGDLEVILTVRSSTLSTHAGDTAFPGDIDTTATAKREAFEEIRLPPSASKILTLLEPTLSRYMQVVTPVVAFCPGMTTADISSLYPNPGEVTAIFTEPLESFISPRKGEHHWSDISWGIAEERMHRFDRCGSKNFLLGQDDENTGNCINGSSLDRSKVGWSVWGMTAGVLIHVAKIAYQREPDFDMYAPNQIHDPAQVVEWYNQTYGLRSNI